MATNYSSNIVTRGLVFFAYGPDPNSYPGAGETWYDLSANKNNITLYNSPSFSPQKRGLEFNGTNMYGRMDGFAGVLSTSDAFTISIWYYCDSSSQTYGYSRQLLSCHENSGWNNKARIAVDCRASSTPGRGGYFVGGEWAGSDSYVGDIDYNDQTWHNLTITRPAGINQTTTYRTDTVSDGTIATNPPWSDVDVVSVGMEWDGGPTVSDYWKGVIGMIMIHNKDLSVTEITQNFNAQRKWFGV